MKMKVHLTIAFGTMLQSGFVHACAVCGGGEDAAKGAFLSSTAMLSVVPLSLLGGLFWYIRRLYRLKEQAEKGQ